MDWKLFFAGVGFLTAAYFIVRNLKREKPASEKTDWKGPVLSLYIQGWGAFILCIIVGIVFIIESFF
jgi:hypothetical protein